MASCQEAEGRVRQLEAELDVAKKECNDLEHQVAKVCDECDMCGKTKSTVYDAETDKRQLIEANEHFCQANESLSTLLCEKCYYNATGKGSKINKGLVRSNE